MFEENQPPLDSIEQVAKQLVERIRPLHSVAIAFSGGVDSAVVCAAAFRALGAKAVAVTGIGPAVSGSERMFAIQVAREIGIRHVELETREIEDANYIRNDGRRCFHCKSNLYSAIQNWAKTQNLNTIVSGTNWDDLGDYRPGLEAAANHEVIAPLAEAKISKAQVRELARYWKVSVSEKPASPCLASRIAYGEPVTPERLHQIEMSEQVLHELGFEDVRVRLHPGGVARLEIHHKDWSRVLDLEVSCTISKRLKELGFLFVTMDLQSRQTGSLNRMLPVLGDVGLS